VLLRKVLDVFKDPEMNPVNDQVRPNLPAGGRPHFVPVPACALKTRAATGKRDQQELSLAGVKITTQVPGMDLSVGSQLSHGRRLRGHGELEQPGLLPGSDGFNERARGEKTLAHGADSPALNRGAYGVASLQARVSPGTK